MLRKKEWKQESSREVIAIVQVRGGSGGLDHRDKKSGPILDLVFK